MTTDYPGAISYPAHPSNTLGTPCNPRAWVLHTPEEPADDNPGTPAYFAGPNRSASTHYFVAFRGQVYQCVREDTAPIANGLDGKPLPGWALPGVSLNRQTLSVEIEGYAATIGQTMPRGSAQWKSLVELVAYGCKKYGIPADRAHIMGHYELSVNRSDPGTLDIGAVVADVQAKLAGVAPAPAPVEKEEDVNFYYTLDTKRVYVVGATGKRHIGPGEWYLQSRFHSPSNCYQAEVNAIPDQDWWIPRLINEIKLLLGRQKVVVG